MDRIVVARIVGVVGFVCVGAPLDALAQQCVNTASPQCAYVASQVGDFEVMEDGPGRFLFLTNVGDDPVPWGGAGGHNVVLRVLDANGLNPSNHTIATDYQGSADVNGPEFIVPPPGSPVNLGILYRAPAGVQAFWRLPGAANPWDFNRNHLGLAGVPEIMNAPPGAYPAAGIPDGVGVYGVIGVPPTSPGYAQCPYGHCYTDLDGTAVVAATMIVDSAITPDQVRSTAQHPTIANRFATTSAGGMTVWERTPGLLRPLATFVDPLRPKPTDCTNLAAGSCKSRETLRGELHPTTGEILWFLLAGDASTVTDDEEVQVLQETTVGGVTTLTLVDRAPYDGWGEHLHGTTGDGGVAAYFQLRAPENNLARQGSYAVGVDAGGSVWPVQKFSDCSHATELVWNDGTGFWMSYAASQGAVGAAVNVYRCNL